MINTAVYNTKGYTNDVTVQYMPYLKFYTNTCTTNNTNTTLHYSMIYNSCYLLKFA